MAFASLIALGRMTGADTSNANLLSDCALGNLHDAIRTDLGNDAGPIA